MEQSSSWRAAVWPAALAFVTVAGSLAAACLMPFTALAVMAAATLPPARSAAVVVGAWTVNQAIGFGLLGYPHTADAALQGVGLLVAALTAQVVARVAGLATGGPLGLWSAFAAGFAAYEGALFAAAHLTGGLDTFTPAIVGQIAMTEAAWFAGLALVSLTVHRAAPGLAPHRAVLRPA